MSVEIKANVLIVEDDKMLGEAICDELHRAGFCCRWDSGQLSLVDFKLYSHALLDLRLNKDNNGFHILENILSENPNCRVVVYTGYGNIRLGVEAIKRGAADFLVKPVTFERVYNALFASKPENSFFDLKPQSLDEVEKEHISFILAKNSWNVSKAAKDLGMYRQSLQRKLKKLF